jgi:hypothetical protein
VIYAERHIPLHDGILERTLDEVEHERKAERNFWARIAAEGAAERDERLRNGPYRRERARVNRQRQAHSGRRSRSEISPLRRS